MHRIKRYAFALIFLFFVNGLSAQPNKKPLTNADVVEMVHAGLGESTIILSIKNSETNFDVSPQALIALKKSDVSQNIMDAMLNAANASASPAAADPGTDNGKALMKKVITALGGESAIQAVKATRTMSVRDIKTPSGNTTFEIVQTSVYPDKVSVELKSSQYNSKSVYQPGGAFITLNGKLQPFPEAAQHELLNNIKMSLIYIAQHVDDPKCSFVIAGKEKIGPVETAILEISVDGNQTRWNVDPASGRLIRVTRMISGPTGAPALTRFEYDDWRSINDVAMPFKVFQNGTLSEVKSYEINPEIPAGLFDKPTGVGDLPGAATAQTTTSTVCPVQILEVNPHSFVSTSEDPWGYALKVKYKNSSNKEIIAVKFAANFYNALHEKKESAWNYTSDERVKPAATKNANWSDGVYVNEIGMRIGAEVWPVKVLFLDNTTWQDDGSMQCKSGIWATPVK
jgi:hypothetical protein